MTDPFAISVVIRTRDSARTLERVILGLDRADGDEVIVVDSGSRDATLEIARKHGAVIVPAPGPFNYSRSLNLGFAAAKNPWVLVLSSHAIPIVDRFLEIHRAAAKKFPADVVVGYAPGDMTSEPQLTGPGNELVFLAKCDAPKINQICGNANSIYRRSAWVELPFDEAIRTAEDKIWMVEMVKRNHRFASIPAARTVNRNQGSLAYMFRKGFSDRRALNTWISRSGQLKGLDESGATAGEPIRPMTLWQLGGAFKQHTRLKLSGRIDTGNWIRYSAHILGQFAGSYCHHDNMPKKKP
jgi:cellulose synthase/poly-beta-1,6-N-acetylglucosamine synthase-like glycosyltransferase